MNLNYALNKGLSKDFIPNKIIHFIDDSSPVRLLLKLIFFKFLLFFWQVKVVDLTERGLSDVLSDKILSWCHFKNFPILKLSSRVSLNFQPRNFFGNFWDDWTKTAEK